MRRARKIVIPVVILISIFFSWYYLSPREDEVQEELFTETELKFLEPFKNQTITLGYFKGQETNYRKAVKNVMQNELSINLDIVQYDNYEKLEAAAISGDLDFFINMSNGDKRDELHSISFPLLNTSFVVTNRHNPLGTINELGNSKVGFLTDSLLYEEYQETIGEGYFFDTVDEALDALDNQEIDAFLTRVTWVMEELVDRKNLQREFTFQYNITNFELMTAREELYPILEVLREIVNSPRANILREKLEVSKTQSLENRIRAYIQETYASVIETYETIEVGHHEMNFPYSYFDTRGASAGIYIEKLELFQAKTGIQYRVQNELAATNYVELFDELMNNNIQFLFGIGHVHESEEIVTIGTSVDDNTVSIVTYENKDVETRALSEIKFGIVTTPEAAKQALGPTNFTIFEDYDSAFEALAVNDIDVLIARGSVLAYYQNVRGYSTLISVDIITGTSEHSVLGNVNNEDLNHLMEDIHRLYYLINGENPEVIGNNLAIDYQSRYLELRERQGQLVGLLFLIGSLYALFVIFKMSKQNRFLKSENERDPLTGLYNRSTSEKMCHTLIEKNPTTFGAFFFFDLDDLKFCNDTYGHGIGDKLIIEFAKTLLKFEDDNTVCCRIAGDEFSIFRMGFQNKNEIDQMISEMKQELKCDLYINDQVTVPVRFSAGGSIYNSDTTDFSNLKKYADLTMYQAKHERKKIRKDSRESATIKLFDIASFRMQSSHIIDTILSEKQIYAVYQSVNLVESGEVYGYEGLTRVTNPNVSNVIELIELAESQRKMRELDLLMMETSLRSFRGTGILFVNMEYKIPELIEEYIEKMIQIAKEIGMPTNKLGIEVSERKQWSQESIKVLNRLKTKFKFTIAVDDFGVGFANNYLLLTLKPDIVKIDRSLVCNINEDKEKYEYLKSLIEFIKKQKMQVTYEGIEIIEELNALKTIGSGLGQGWYFEKPRRHD